MLKANTLNDLSDFTIKPFKGCPISGKLTFDGNKGTLNYFLDKKPLITLDLFSSVNGRLIESIVNQARVICDCKSATLWNY